MRDEAVRESHLRRASIGDIAAYSFLWPPVEYGRPLYFCPVVSIFFFLSIFFPRLISAAVDWMSTILPHDMWPYSANLEYRSEMCCSRLGGNVGRKK